MWDSLIAAIALVLVFEGILPFLCPHCWRRSMARLIHMNDGILRAMGLFCMLMGLIVLMFVGDG